MKYLKFFGDTLSHIENHIPDKLFGQSAVIFLRLCMLWTMLSEIFLFIEIHAGRVNETWEFVFSVYFCGLTGNNAKRRITQFTK